MPIGILVSLLVCTILYMLFAHVMTGVAHYSEFGGQQGIAPVAIAIEHMGEVDASGVLHPDYPLDEQGNRPCHPIQDIARSSW